MTEEEEIEKKLVAEGFRRMTPEESKAAEKYFNPRKSKLSLAIEFFREIGRMVKRQTRGA